MNVANYQARNAGSMQSKIVSFHGVPPRTARSAEAVVLLSLTADHAQPAAKRPLVCLTLEAVPVDESYRYRTSPAKRQIRLWTETSLAKALLPPKTCLPDRKLVRTGELILDERYYHHTLKSWTSKTDVEKLMIAASAMQRPGCYAFTVQFSERRRLTLEAADGSIFRKLRNELAALSDLGPVALVVERSGQDRIHLHGLIQTTAKKADVRLRLLDLGGRSSDQVFTNLHQVRIDQAYSTVGWALYCTKQIDSFQPIGLDNWIYLSHGATQLGDAHLRELRDLAFRKLGLEAELRGRALRRRPASMFIPSLQPHLHEPLSRFH